MPRPMTPDGKRVTLSVKVSESTAAQIESARYGLSVSEWLESAINLKLRDARRQERRISRGAITAEGVRETQREQHRRAAAPAITFTAPLDSPNARIALSGHDDPDCPHPKARVIKGFCGACGTHVGT